MSIFSLQNISYSIGREDESELYSGSSTYFHAYPHHHQQQLQRFKYRQESNYSDISLNVYEPADKYNQPNNNNNTVASISSPYYQLTRTDFNNHHHHHKNFKGINLLYLLKIDPFKFATMEPIQIDNKIIGMYLDSILLLFLI